MLPFAGFLAVGQCAKNRDGSVQAREEIGDRDPDLTTTNSPPTRVHV